MYIVYVVPALETRELSYCTFYPTDLLLLLLSLTFLNHQLDQ